MITVERHDDVTVLRLAHGKVNALDVELLDELTEILDGLRDETGGLVVTGNGRVFSAGVDLGRVLDGGADYAERLIPALTRAFVALFAHPRPLVAAIDGAAIAGGCIIAAACDHRLMADGPAPIGVTELVVGVPFPVAAIEIIRHACGHHTDDLVFRARRLTVAEAVAVGLVHQVAAPDELEARAMVVASELGALAPEAYALAKRSLRADAIARIERDADAFDDVVRRSWASGETAARIRAQLDRLRG